MSTLQRIAAVCDGWDATVITDAGEGVTLHYAKQPAEATVLADCASYVAAVAEAKATEAAKIAAEVAAVAAKEAKVAQADAAIATAAAVVAQAQVEITAAEAKAADHLTLIDAWKKLEQKTRDSVLAAWPEFEVLLKEAAI
jgi:hypothetical protein